MTAAGGAAAVARTTSVRKAAARVAPVAAFVAAVAAAVSFVVAQPVRSPWWTYADADASYTSQGLDLLHGTRMAYLGHPGLPLSELGAVAFTVDYGRARLSGSSMTRAEYVDDRLLDLDKTRPIYRGIGIAIYLIGAALAFLLLARLFGGWFWGLAGSLLWLAAPGLYAMSIMFRADVALGVAVLVFAYLIGRAVEERTPLRYGSATVVAGFAVMLKLHAVGLIPALVVAAVWRPPPEGWWSEVRAAPQRLWSHSLRGWRRWCLLSVLLATAAFGVFFNANLPHGLTLAEKLIVFQYLAIVGLLLVAGVAADRFGLPAAARRVLTPFAAFLGAAFLVGLAIPAILDVPDWLLSLILIRDAFLGRGINSGVGAFDATSLQLDHPQMLRGFLVLGLAGVAAAIGVIRRDARPLVWFAGAVALDVMAFARQGYTHYFAPGFVLTIPAVLWLARQLRARAAVAATAVLVVIVLVPTYQLRSWPAESIETHLQDAGPSTDEIMRRLQPNEVALTGLSWPEPDNRWFINVESYSNYVPVYPYRFLPAWSVALPAATVRGLTPRYYIGPEVASLQETATVPIWDIGELTLRPIPGYPYAAEILDAPRLSSLREAGAG